MSQPARWASRSRRLPVVCPRAQRWERASSRSRVPSPHCHPTTPIATGAAHPPTCTPLGPSLHETGDRWNRGRRRMRRGCGHRFCAAFALLSSHSRLQGVGETWPARVSYAWPPVRASQGGDVSTTRVLCRVHDPCTPHLSHATLRTPTRAQHPNGGAQGSCTWNARGVVLTRSAGGASASPRCPPVRMAQVQRRPIARAPAGRKGGRVGPCGTPAREWREGCPPRRLRARSHPGGPSKRPLVLARMARGRGLCRAPAFLCPDGARMRPPLHKRGRD